MNYKKKIILLITGLCFSLTSLFSFPPRDLKIFEQNCLRLLSNSQYSYLTDYFSRYYSKFSNESEVGYIEKMLTKIPFAQQKKKILSVYFKETKKKNNQLIFLAGQLALFLDEAEEAINFFKVYKGKNKNFYLAFAYQSSGNFVDAETIYLKLLKKNDLVAEQVRILLVEIYLKWGNKRQASFHIKKIKNISLKKALEKRLSQID